MGSGNAASRWAILATVALTAGACHRKEEETAGASAAKPDLAYVNALRPGEADDIERFRALGRTTVFEFYSPSCEPCKKMDPVIEFLSTARPDVSFRKVNIDRL